MGNSKFTAHYWQHKCPAASPEDGDDVASDHPDIKYDEVTFAERWNFKEKSLLGRKCTVDGCNYVVNEETVILNKKKEEIRNLGGKNLYPFRADGENLHMQCCKWNCGNKYTTGHCQSIPIFNEPGGHACSHAVDYHPELQNGITERLPGCKCNMINRYGEPVGTWVPGSKWYGAPIPGSPLDLDLKYEERKKAQAVDQ